MTPRLAARLALVACVTFAACGVDRWRAPVTPDQYRTQIPASGQGDPWTAVWPGRQDVTLHLSPEAEATIAGLARASLDLHTELAACVVGFRMYAGDSAVRRFRLGDSVRVAIDVIGKAHPFASDSLQIRAAGELCDAGVPVVHTHVVPNPWLFQPSPTDVHSAERRSAPFDLLVSAPGPRVWVLTVYGMRRE